MKNDWQVLQRIIRERKTEKVFGDPESPVEFSPETLAEFDSVVWQSLMDAGWAPFHYDRKQAGMAEPWRVYWLDYRSCRNLAMQVEQLIPDLKPGNKLASMLSACGGVALFTWLPQLLEDEKIVTPSKLQQINNEHLAATSAAVQNFLLLCTAAGLCTYWGSGTVFGQHLFKPLGIGSNGQIERLLGAVFVNYPVTGDQSVTFASGAQREKRSVPAAWLRRIEFGKKWDS